jgi:Protein of unknown function (DUF2799)
MENAWLRCSGLLLLCAGALAGCAAMSQRECQLGDWHTAGFDDGARGVPVTRIADYSKACSKYGVSPDLTAYRSGYDEGLQTYCREGNGYVVGSAGAPYNGVCPSSLEPQFMQGFRVGRQLFELQASVNDLQNQIASREYALRENTEQLAAASAAIMSDSTPSDQRAALIVKVAELSQEQGALRAQIDELQRNLAVRQVDLARFRESVAYNH